MIIDLELEDTPITAREAEVNWARKQLEYAAFERKQRAQRNNLVWIVRTGTKYMVTQRGQLKYTKADIYTSRAEAMADAANRLEARLAVEDAANPNNTYIRQVLEINSRDE